MVDKKVLLTRVSFAGELGWELHANCEDIPVIFDAVMVSGARHFGMYALDSLRIEKGYQGWKGDLSSDYTLLEAGLDRFMDLTKSSEFLGKTVLKIEQQKGVQKRFVSLRVAAGDCDAHYMAPIWFDSQIVGEATSGAWGHRVGHSVVLGYVRHDLAQEGTELEVEIFGELCMAQVQAGTAVWDPHNLRLQA